MTLWSEGYPSRPEEASGRRSAAATEVQAVSKWLKSPFLAPPGRQALLRQRDHAREFSLAFAAFGHMAFDLSGFLPGGHG